MPFQTNVFKDIIDAVHEPLLVLDFDLKVIYANRRFYDLFQVTAKITLGRLIYDLGNGQWDFPQLRALLLDILQKDISFDNFQIEQTFPDIGLRIMLLNAHRIIQEKAGKKRILLAIEDITERKKAEDALASERTMREHAAYELAAANFQLEAYSFAISHELQTPVRSMEGFSRALLEDYTDKLDITGKDYLERIHSASLRMSELITALLDMARLTRGELHAKEVNLSSLAQIVVDDLRMQDSQRKVEFIIAEKIMVCGDSTTLGIVLRNLLDNAWKFTSNHLKAKIEFGVSDMNGQKVYFIRDDGAGFDEQFAANMLFKPFKRLHMESEFPGQGIGLAMVNSIILRHEGRIWAESKVEKGATFYFTIGL